VFFTNQIDSYEHKKWRCICIESIPPGQLIDRLRVRENDQRDAVIGKLEERIDVPESRLNEIKKQPNTDVSM
jgi:hypothetical protein